MVNDLMDKRRKAAPNGTAPVEIMGPGSILSAVRWSPLLNDALMLGGIQARQTFHLALNVDEQVEWRKLETTQTPITEAERRKVAFESKRGMFGAPAQAVAKNSERRAKDLWLKFIHNVPRVIWERGTPRVFARELLGLKLFGYKPQFDINGLGILPKRRRATANIRELFSRSSRGGLYPRDSSSAFKLNLRIPVWPFSGSEHPRPLTRLGL